MSWRQLLMGCISCLTLVFSIQASEFAAEHFDYYGDGELSHEQHGVETAPSAPVELENETNQGPLGAADASPSGEHLGRPTCRPGGAGRADVDWSKVPFSIASMPRVGNFPILPAGPGYYSASDWLMGTWREQRPASGYPPYALMPPSLFDADFRYVDGKPAAERSLVESLKRIRLSNNLMFSTGGQAWVRYMKEQNSRLTEVENSYALTRARVFGDIMLGDLARVYGEYLWADSINPELPPLPIDEDLGDILNLFLDVNVLEWDDHPLVARVGRQELLLGSQRLVSTLDWANVRRTFEGARLFRRGAQWDFDAFWTQFVPAVASEFDRPDENQIFAGTWLTYRPEQGELLDFYYLFLNNSNDIQRQDIVQAPLEAHTLGSRWTGDEDGWLWDFEGAVQWGDSAGHDLVAGAGTAGLGRHLKQYRWNPTAWIYFDYASGDSDPNAGTAHTFNDLYPFGHYYLGWADLVGRRNIQDLNAHLYLYPTHWMTVWLQYHHFWLAASRDALYSAGGVPLRRDATGQSGSNVGDELDLVVNFHLTSYSDFMFGYSRLFGGGFLENTAGPNAAPNSDLLFMMYQMKW